MIIGKRLQITLKQQQYYLDHDINPSEPGAPTFMRMFIENSGPMFIPLLVMVIASDLVSSEHSLGSIKLLLTQAGQKVAGSFEQIYCALILYFDDYGHYRGVFIPVIGVGIWVLRLDAPVINGFSCPRGKFRYI